MLGEFGGLQIAGGSAAVQLPIGTPTLFTTGWAALAAGRHGNLSCVEDAATGKLTLKPGSWLVRYNLTLETEDESSASTDSVSDSSLSGVSSSSTSSSSPAADVDAIVAQLYRGGSAVAGSKAKVSALLHDEIQELCGQAIIEITDAMVNAGTNYVQLYLAGAGGEYVTVYEGQFFALKLK